MAQPPAADDRSGGADRRASVKTVDFGARAAKRTSEMGSSGAPQSTADLGKLVLTDANGVLTESGEVDTGPGLLDPETGFVEGSTRSQTTSTAVQS